MNRRCRLWLDEVSHHLHHELLPFWRQRGVDEQFGGFLTYLDRNGNATGEGDKTLVCQARMIYTFSSIARAGFDDGYFIGAARQGVDFLINHFWDEAYGGWYWVTARDGTAKNPSKLTYGQSFAVYALSEYGMASGDPRGLEWADRTYGVLQEYAADNGYGGYYEFLDRDWSKKKPGVYGGDRKSFDIHMHLMEAFTNYYEATQKLIHKERGIEMINLLFKHIIDTTFGTGVAQFGLDWTPLRAILFRDVWGSDRDVQDDGGRPLNNTSFGHNVEFAWLLNHSLRILTLPVEEYKERMLKLYDHAAKYGVDWHRGGLYCEGPHDGPARERNKEFWQQAEALVGFLDAFILTQDERYLDAYEKIHRFVMDYNINHDVGEWFPLFDENNTLLWDYMGHAWKINYHTVRSMIQSEKRLKQIVGSV